MCVCVCVCVYERLDDQQESVFFFAQGGVRQMLLDSDLHL